MHIMNKLIIILKNKSMYWQSTALFLFINEGNNSLTNIYDNEYSLFIKFINTMLII